MFVTVALLALGVIVGFISGLVGIGGGVLIVPALVYLFGVSQQTAQGTTLAVLIPPIGILAALAYYQAGHVDLKIALLICLGFVIGGWFGATYAIKLPVELMTKVFAVFLILIGIKMLFNHH